MRDTECGRRDDRPAGTRHTDRLFCVEAAVLFPFVVVGGTAILAGRRGRDGEPDR